MADFETHPIGTGERLKRAEDFIDRLVERAMLGGALDDDDDLWREAAQLTRRDLSTGNRLSEQEREAA